MVIKLWSHNQEDNMSRKMPMFVGIVGIVILVVGCASRTVRRVEIEKKIDLSGHWNDVDAQLVAEEMISDCLAKPWINKFNETDKREPVVIIGTVVNKSYEHINSQIFIKELEKNMLNSGLVKFVASAEERQEIREERMDQQERLTEKTTINPIGHETGADFMMKGTINAVKDEVKGKYVILYQVNLELIDLTNNQKVWIGQKKIKKYAKKRAFSF